VKLWLLLAVAAALLALGYLVWAPHDDGPRSARPPGARPTPRGELAQEGTEPGALATEATMARVRRDPRSAQAQNELAGFVARCVARGAAAVPELVAFLHDGDDVECGRGWQVVDGELRGYPTLRAAFVDALRRIPGSESTAALRDVVGATRSGGEAYLAALTLRARRETGWERALLALVGAHEPAARAVQTPMVELAAAAAPEETVRALEERAPRGEADPDPGPLARALTHLPWDAAQQAGGRLLDDPNVTATAKRRYVDALLRRLEPEALGIVRLAVERGTLPDAIHRHIVATTVEAPAFLLDARAYAAARKAGDEAATRELRERAEARVDEGRRILTALFAGRLESAQAKQAFRRLDAQLSRFGGLR
jgi:hypothetical protein